MTSAGNLGIGTTAPTNNLEIGSFSTDSGYVLAANSSTQYGAIVQTSEATPSSTAALWIRTTPDGGTTKNTVLRVQNNGNVGIGTSNPSSPLYVTTASMVNSPSYVTSMFLAPNSRTTNGTSYLKAMQAFINNSILDVGVTDNGYRIGGAFDAYMSSTGFAGTLNENIGVWARAGIYDSAGTGTINSSNAIYAEMFARAGIINSASVIDVNFPASTGIARNSYGVKINSISATGTDAGQPHNAYGLYIANAINASGGSTNNAWSIYSNSVANSYFAGNVGIGTTTPDALLSVNGTASKSGGGSWATFSDIRLKNVDGNFEYGLDEILKINPIYYHYKEGNIRHLPTTDQHVGIVAQELQKFIPDAITTTHDGYLMVNNDPVIWAMVNAIKDFYSDYQENIEMFQMMHDGLEKRVTEAERKIASLDEKNKKLENKVLKLEKDNQELREAVCAINPRAKICGNK